MMVVMVILFTARLLWHVFMMSFPLFYFQYDVIHTSLPHVTCCPAFSQSQPAHQNEVNLLLLLNVIKKVK